MQRPRRVGVLIRAALLVLALALGPAAARASAPGLPDFSQRAWTVRDGAPSDVWALAGGRDGVLWLGTGLGLYRFDGLRFERHRPPGGEMLPALNINALLVDDDGTLWLGEFEGGVTRLTERGITRFGAAQGLPGGRVLRLARADDALWAADARGLARFDGERWRRVDAAMGYPEPGAEYLFRDRQGTLWVSSGERLYRLRAGAGRFEYTGIEVGRYAVIAQDGEDRLWLSDAPGGVRPLGLSADIPSRPLPEPAPPPPSRDGRPVPPVKQLLFTGDGSLWVTVQGRGVFRADAPDRVEPGQTLDWRRGEWFTVRDGLGSTTTVPLLEGDEGEIWIGNNLGINSLRPRRIRGLDGIEDLDGRGFVVQPRELGALVYAGPVAWGIDPPGEPQRLPALDPRRPARHALLASDGTAWQIGADALWRQTPNARWQRWPLPLPAGVAHAELDAMAADPVGGLWLALRDAGVFHVTRAGIVRVPEAEQPEGSGNGPDVIAVDADRSVWFGHDGALVGLDDEGHRWRFDAAQGLRTGRITALLPSRHGLVVAGENGVALGRDGRFSTITIEREPAFGRVSGIVESADGDLWLNGGRGLVRLDAREVAALFTDAAHPISFQLLDAGDGLPGVAQQVAPMSTAVRDGRGRLWFATNQGVAWLDPAQVRRSPREIGVDVRTLLAGGQSYTPWGGLALPKGTRSLTLRYAARVLDKADQVRYRVRLVGVDAVWREAGTQREATYANLGPGDYRFEVLASNPDGLWGRRPSTLAFRIEPSFYQHPAFRWAVAALLVLAVWAGYRLRVRALQSRLGVRLEERHRERERIARDLHDTLLQGFQGLLLGLDTSVRRVADVEVRHRLERDLTRAETLLAEGRDRVGQLRLHGGPGGVPVDACAQSLAEQLAHAGQDLIRLPAQFRMKTWGTPRALPAAVEDQVLLIAREALTNAQRHAQAMLVELTLDYRDGQVEVTVRDDGIGLTPDWDQGGACGPRYGLCGMAERARLLSAGLTVAGAPGAGTEVVLTLDAQVVSGRWRRVARAMTRWWSRRRGHDPVKSRGARAKPAP